MVLSKVGFLKRVLHICSMGTWLRKQILRKTLYLLFYFENKLKTIDSSVPLIFSPMLEIVTPQHVPGNCRQLGCRLNAFCSAYFSACFFFCFVCLRIVMKTFHGKFETLAYPTMTTSAVTSGRTGPSVRNSIYSQNNT